MAATREILRAWLEEGKAEKATHTIIVCDTYDWEDYPVHVAIGEDAKKKVESYNTMPMQRIMEVYDLSQDLEEQLNADRVFNY